MNLQRLGRTHNLFNNIVMLFKSCLCFIDYNEHAILFIMSFCVWGAPLVVFGGYTPNSARRPVTPVVMVPVIEPRYGNVHSISSSLLISP